MSVSEKARALFEYPRIVGKEAEPEELYVPIDHVEELEQALRAALATDDRVSVPVDPTEAIVDASMAFDAQATYLQHPSVRPFNGTNNGDSIEGWKREYHAARYRAMLAAAQETAACCWKEDADGVWETDCGNAHQFTADGPIENKAKFCCYCGKTLMALPYPIEDEDDDDAR